MSKNLACYCSSFVWVSDFNNMRLFMVNYYSYSVLEKAIFNVPVALLSVSFEIMKS